MPPTALRFNRLFCVTCLIALTSHSPTFSQDLPIAEPEDVGVSSTRVEELSTFMQSLVDDGKIAGGVTMMARHGKVIHLKAVGMADREAGTPMKTDAIFRIASMTKPVTSVAIMMLCEEGKLGLDDPVSKYIPEFSAPKVLVLAQPLGERPAKREITIRHLLTHTSGLGYIMTATIGPLYEQQGLYGGLEGSPLTTEQYVKKVAGIPLLFDPGSRWEYGMSMDVLGQVIQVASGTSLDRFIEDRLCRPIGMMDTSFRLPPSKMPRQVSAYVPTDDGIRKVMEGKPVKLPVAHRYAVLSSDYPYTESNRYLSGGAGLCCTASDYMRFCQMLLNGGTLNGIRLLREQTVAMMTTNQIGEVSSANSLRYGLGLDITPDTDDVHEQLRGSYNGGGAWSTSFRISPVGDWIVVTMTQVGWDDKLTPEWFMKYDKIAADAIEK